MEKNKPIKARHSLILLGLIVLYALISINIASASFVWGNNYTYDTYVGATINQTLWQNITTVSGSGSPGNAVGSQVANEYIEATCSGFGSQPVATNCGEFSFYTNTSRMPNINNIETVRFRNFIGSGGTSSGFIGIFGTEINYLNMDSNYSIIRNRTAGTNVFDVFNDSGYLTQITASNNIIKTHTTASANPSGSATGRLYQINYTYGNTTININLISPPNNKDYYIINNIVDFNVTTNITINNLKNITLYINSIANESKTISGTSNTTVFNKTFGIGNYNWQVYVCDDGNNCIFSSSKAFNVNSFNANSENYNNQTIEGNIESFSANFTLSGVLSSAYLVYDGTSYLASTNNDGTNWILSRTITTPFVSVTTNKTFYWKINMVSGSANSTAHNQTVQVITLDNCSTNTNLLYNFTVYNQDSLGVLNTANATFDLNLNIAPYGTTNYFLNFSKSYGNATSKTVCINIPLNQSVYSISMTIGYQQYGYTKQFYYLDNVTLSNATNPQVSLYDLLLTQSTEFLVGYTGADSNGVPNAIVHLYRYYIGEGLYREVEMGMLDSNSMTHLHLIEEDEIYYFTVTLHNQLLYTSSNYMATCISSPCQIILSGSTPFTSNPVDWGVYNGTSIALSLDKPNRLVYLYFVSDNVHTLNMSLYTVIDGNNVFINTTSLTATAGTLSLFVPYPYGNQTFYVYIYQDGTLIINRAIDLGNSASALFGNFGIFLVILMVACLVLIAGTDGVLTIVFAVVGLVVAVLLYFIDMGWVVIISIVVAGGLIIWKINSRKR